AGISRVDGALAMWHLAGLLTPTADFVGRHRDDSQGIKLFVDAKQRSAIRRFTPATWTSARTAFPSSIGKTYNLLEFFRPDVVIDEMFDDLVRLLELEYAMPQFYPNNAIIVARVSFMSKIARM